MEASREACQDRRERVKAFGVDVVPGYSGIVNRSKLGRVGFGQNVRFRSGREEFLGCSTKPRPTETADGDDLFWRRWSTAVSRLPPFEQRLPIYP